MREASGLPYVAYLHPVGSPPLSAGQEKPREVETKCQSGRVLCFLTNQRTTVHSLARSDPKSLFRRTYNPLRVGDCLAINLRPHDRSERRLRADKPSEDIHQLRDLRRSIEIHHHENLAACRIAIEGLRMEPSGAKAGFTFQVHPHMLRHACGFKLANDGADTRSLQHYLGHKNRVWSVVATHPSGQQEHIVGFHTEAEALEWRVSQGCRAWLTTRGYVGWKLRPRMRANSLAEAS